MNERTGNLINKKFMQYLIPTIFMSMALSLGTIVDGIICANYIGTDALAAVNLCVPVILGFNAIISILGVGGSTAASTAMGRREKEKADACFTISLLFLFLAGALVTVFGIVKMDFFVEFAAGSSQLKGLVEEYLSVYVYGALAFFLVPGIAYFVRGDGNPTLSAMILIVANVVNLCCDMIYIRFLGFGIRGAALASLTGYIIGCLFVAVYFLSKKRSLHFSRAAGKNLSVLWEMILVGLPSALNSILMFIKIAVLNRVALKYLGDHGAAIVAVCNNCLSFAAIFIGGAAQTMLPIIAVLHGEEDQNGILFAVKKALRVVLYSSAVMLILFEVFPGAVAGVFGANGGELADLARLAIRLFGLSLPLFGVDYIFMSYYQATGHKNLATFVTVAQGFLFIVPMVLILSALFPQNGLGIWLSFVVAECATFAATVAVSLTISRRTGHKGVFILKPNREARELDLSIPSQLEKATGISGQVIAFCLENGMEKKAANAAGIAIEEMTANTILYGYKNKPTNYIDVNVKLMGQRTIIRIRDNGILFNPAEFVPEQPEGLPQEVSLQGIQLVKSLAKSVEYTRTLGMNNLIIKI